MEDEIPLFEIAWDERDLKNAIDSITRGSYWAKGPFVDEFESELESYLDVEHAVTVNSGTTALVAALEAADVGPGDEVIVPSYSFIATANAARLAGAEPVFADIETETYGPDPGAVEELITDDTAAIIPVHLYGGPCRIKEIRDLADRHDLLVVEDAAEAFGSTYGDEYVGTFGDAGVFSFCQNKIVVTGEGGAIVTDDNELASKLRLYRSHGRASSDYFQETGSGEYLTLGTNIRMSDLTAAIGCAQLEKVDRLIGGRREAASRLNEALEPVEGVHVPAALPDSRHVYQLYTVEFDPEVNRQTVIETLDEHGISSKIYWETLIHDTAYYRETTSDTLPELPRSEDVASRVLSLPMYPDLTPAQTDRIAAAVVEGIERAMP